MIDPIDIDFDRWSQKETEAERKIEREEMSNPINLTIHEEDHFLIEIMGITNPQIFDPVERDMTGRTAIREIILGNVTLRIYAP
jgi:hypothetical protein